MSAAVSVFKLSVQSVRHLQLHKIEDFEVSFEMTGLPYILYYQWTPVANYSTSIARHSAMLVGFGMCSIPVSHPHDNPKDWDMAT